MTAAPARHPPAPAFRTPLDAQLDRRGLWLAWAAAVGVLFLLRLGAAPLFDIDEGAFAEATREMLASGDWLHTTLLGADRFDKPIFVYWLQLASVGLLGASDAAVRLPSALCGWGWCLAAAHFARPRFGAAAAMAGGTVLACCVGVLAIGRAATADALLNVLLALTLFELWRFLENGSRPALRRMALWMALGVLTKGPVAVLVPGATWLLWLLLRRGPASRALGVLRDPWAWVILVAVATPWYAYALHRHGQAFIDGFLMRHNVNRFSTALEGHSGGPLYYAVMLPVLMLPWLPFLIAALVRARAAWREPLGTWLLLWAGFVLAFFSLSGTKLPHYVLYGVTPLALLVGRQLVEAGRRGWHRAQAVAFAATLALMAAAPWVVIAQAPRIAQPLYRALLAGAPPPALWPALLALAALVGVQAFRTLAPAQRALLSGLVLAAYVSGVATPWWGEALQGPVRRAADAAKALQAREPGVAIVQWTVNQPSFAWRLGAVTPKRAPQAGELALVRLDRLPPDGYELLWSERGLGLVRWRAAAPAS